jgi:PAS domain S-box-containing protein
MEIKGKSKKEPLRKRAERFLAQHPEPVNRSASNNLQRLNHELQVHQVELEMQNEELRQKQAALEALNDQYVDLYEFAPVGYFILDRKGKILEVNLTGVHLVGLPRSRVVGMPFTVFLDKDSIASFLRHMMEVFSADDKQACACDLTMHPRPEKTPRYVSLESVSIGAGNGARMRSAVIDVTERRLAELEVLRTHQELAEANERLQHLSDRLLAVQDEERRRIAYEVHDSFTSSLAAIRYKLTSFPVHPENKKGMQDVLNQLRTIIDDARKIQSSLLPPVLDDLGLVVAVNSLCREFRQNNPRISMETEFGIEEREIRLPIKIQIFRIAQEALNNAAKHASADSIQVMLTKGESSVDLVIRDNGRGFDVKKALSKKRSIRGLGLLSMEERATLSGGTFRIESAPGNGTSLRVSWPLT